MLLIAQTVLATLFALLVLRVAHVRVSDYVLRNDILLLRAIHNGTAISRRVNHPRLFARLEAKNWIQRAGQFYELTAEGRLNLRIYDKLVAAGKIK